MSLLPVSGMEEDKWAIKHQPFDKYLRGFPINFIELFGRHDTEWGLSFA